MEGSVCWLFHAGELRAVVADASTAALLLPAAPNCSPMQLLDSWTLCQVPVGQTRPGCATLGTSRG